MTGHPPPGTSRPDGGPGSPGSSRPVALVTGVGRRIGIGAAIVQRLAADGFDVASSYWTPYDARMSWGADEQARAELAVELDRLGARHVALEADLERTEAPGELFDRTEVELGAVSALVLCHCESVDSGLLDTTVESFDRHMAVNARASWQLIREFGRRFQAPHGTGRIVALTSDHTAGNLPYGASKGALDRITIAASRELAHLGITANVVNPGATDTGWMTPDLTEHIVERTPGGRVGQPDDVANLVSFLCSPGGGWVNGQLLYSDGGISAPG